MAPARRARSPDEESDYASEQETPRPKKSNLKKRLSEVHNPENERTPNGESSGRPPLRSVNINDDAAEKRRRRKSTKIAAIPTEENDQETPAGPSNAADPSRPSGSKQKQLNAINILPDAPITVDSSNFEEWMKMATDNKINAANSWDFALIDYFHDMSLLRNNDDNSINFQRASCTLDGCVKIWTSRVDSVGTETGKLLSNLESEGRNANDDDGADSDDPDADPTQPKKKKHKTGNTVTLAKDASQLKNKKPDVEFTIDPLFRKARADFDEGGAGGLLMNHLSLGIGSEGCMRVIFDGSDPMGKVEEEDVVEEPEDEVDMTFLRKEFLIDLSVLEDKAISHSLAGFSFGNKNTFLDLETPLYNDSPQNHDLDDDDFGAGDFNGGGFDGGNDGPVDFFVGVEAVNDDFGPNTGGDYAGDDHSNGSAGPAPMGNREDGRPGAYVPFDPRMLPPDRDLALVMADPDDGGTLNYFDQNFKKNWAGPEHWKMRRVIRKAPAAASDDVEGEEATAGNKATKSRQKKEVVKIDFLSAPEKSVKELCKELFAPVTKGASINLPGTGGAAGKKGRKKKEKKDEHRLPDDMHFTSKQLVTLFLKPKFYLKMRGRRPKITDGDEVDENFWAQAAADQAANRQHDEDGDEGGPPIPFNTQFFHDDDYGGGFDDDGGFDGAAPEDSGEQDLLAATQGQTRRVRPEFVNYAKKAKRVDVRKLKDNIWKNLDIVIDEKKADESMEVDEDDEDEEKAAPTDPTEARQFGQVITGLQKSYPKEKMEEISTSFCFICLLHLANEQGLKLESSVQDEALAEKGLVVDDEDEVMEEESEEIVPKTEKKAVGNIWDIKIYRDPTASKSA